MGRNRPDLGHPRRVARRAPRRLAKLCRHGPCACRRRVAICLSCHHPPGRPRRFDARFFLVDAEAIASDLDDFGAACDELSHLQWIPLPEVRKFDLPFITEVVLAEISARATSDAPPSSVPFFKNNEEASLFLRLGGKGPLSGRQHGE